MIQASEQLPLLLDGQVDRATTRQCREWGLGRFKSSFLLGQKLRFVAYESRCHLVVQSETLCDVEKVILSGLFGEFGFEGFVLALKCVIALARVLILE